MSKTNDILSKMRSGKKTGAETFLETMQEQVKENKQDQTNEQENKIVPENINKTEHVVINDNGQDHVHKTEHIIETETEHKIINKSILEKYSEKKTKEDLFTRQTYLLRNDLIKRFDKAAQTRRKGFKTDVINELLENFLNESGL